MTRILCLTLVVLVGAACALRLESSETKKRMKSVARLDALIDATWESEVPGEAFAPDLRWVPYKVPDRANIFPAIVEGVDSVWCRTPDLEWREFKRAAVGNSALLLAVDEVDSWMAAWNRAHPLPPGGFSRDLVEVYLRSDATLLSIRSILEAPRAQPENEWRVVLFGRGGSGTRAALQIVTPSWVENHDPGAAVHAPLVLVAAEQTVGDFVRAIQSASYFVPTGGSQRCVPLVLNGRRYVATY